MFVLRALAFLCLCACSSHGVKAHAPGGVGGSANTSRAGNDASASGKNGASGAPDARVTDRDGAVAIKPVISPGVDDGGPFDDDAGGMPTRAVPAPMPSGCITDVSPGRHQLPCEDISHDLNVPEACLHRQCGLILDVHGGTMNGKMEDNNTRMAALGERDGYVVIQPNAANGLFDASTDDAKVYAFAQTAISVFHLDPKRVHMTGFSQGGYMTWRFICQRTEFLASAAPAASAGAANISDETDCSFTGSDRPSQELDILYMHGKRDALVDYQNAVTKADNVRAAFAMGAPVMIAGDATFERLRSTSPNGTVFDFIDHDYASDSSFPAPPPFGIAIEGHCYPGSMDLMPTEPGQLMAFGCVPPTSFNWGEEVIAFFRAHERR